MRQRIVFVSLITVLLIALPSAVSKTAGASTAAAGPTSGSPTSTPSPNNTPSPASTPVPTQAIETLRSSATSTTFVVPATGQWVNTGISLNTGDKLKITASGSWTPGLPETGMVGPDGSSILWPDNFFNLSDIGVCSYCATTNTPSWAALMGYIGNTPPGTGSYTSGSVLPAATQVFLVGSSFQSDRTLSGPLWLNFNDDAYSNGTADNVGQVTAVVTVTPAVVTGAQPQLTLPFTLTPKRGQSSRGSITKPMVANILTPSSLSTCSTLTVKIPWVNQC